MPDELFFGRDAELDGVSRSLTETAQGRGVLLVVVGEPGIGKTRFAREVARRAVARGFAVFEGACEESRNGKSYAPWVRILQDLAVCFDLTSPPVVPGWGVRFLVDLAPDLEARLPRPAPSADGPPRDPAQARFALFDAMAMLLTNVAERHPLLITLDDLHEADAASLLLLVFVARQIGRSRLMVLATAREPGPSTSLPAALAPLASEAQTLALRGLAVGEVQRFVASRTGRDVPRELAVALHRRTDGNPLFVEEIVRALADVADPEPLAVELPALPGSLRQLVLGRLAPLGERGRAAVEAAAVLGTRFSQALLRRTSGLSLVELLDALGDVRRAGLVVESSRERGEHSFSHGLVREIVYEEIETRRRSELHRRAADAYEALFFADVGPVLGELARHALAASGEGSAARAAELCARAGRQALGRFSYEEAATHLRRALEVGGAGSEADPFVRAEIGLDLAEALRRGGESQTAEEVLRRVALESRRARLAEPFARSVLALGLLRGSGVESFDRSGRVDEELRALLEEALAMIPEENAPLRARLLGRLATTVYWAPRSLERRRRLVAEAVSLAEHSGDAVAVAAARTSRRYALWGPDDPEERLAEADGLVRTAAADGDTEREIQARQWRLWDLLQLGRVHEADREIQLFTSLAERLRQPFYLGYATLFRGLRCLLDGRLEAGERLAGEGFELSRQAGDEVAAGLFASQLFHVALTRGRLGPLEQALPGNAWLPRVRLPVERCGALFLLVRAGRLEEARAGFEDLAAGGFSELHNDVTWLPAMFLLADVCAALGDAGRAATLFERLVPYRGQVIVTGPPPAVCFGLVSQVLGQLAATAGDGARALAGYEDAAREATSMGAPVFEAEARCALGELLLDSAPERAQALLGRAFELARDFGIEALASRADAARQGGGPVAPAGAPGPGAPSSSFHRRGELWEVSFAGHSILLKDAKGIRYIASLLRQPGVPVAASALAGRGGRSRAPGDAVERDRKAVRNRIRSAIARIGRHDRILAAHLERSIRTGASCRYEPAGPVVWSVRP